MAQELMAGEKATGVKVVKETYNDDTGDYLTLKIFEDGHNQMKVDAGAGRRAARPALLQAGRSLFLSRARHHARGCWPTSCRATRSPSPN